jgi:hypothetical protein
LDLSRLTGIMIMVAAINIFYTLYGLAQKNWVNTLIPLFTFFILIYAAATIEETAEKLRISYRSKTK